MTDAAPTPARPEARSPRGFADRRGPEVVAERRIVQCVCEVYERWGFEALETGAFEYADALGKFLPDADRPNEGVFALQDDAGSEDGGPWMALRYDLTAPLARFAAQHRETLPRPYRRYAFGPVWRNEKPGPGRFREFVQCDADTVGSDRPEADKLVRELIANVGLNPHDEHSWMTPVCKTEANRDVGVDDLLKEISNHQNYLEKSGKKAEKAKAFLREELVDILIEGLRNSLDSVLATDGGVQLLDQLYRKEIAPYEAAKALSGQRG
jgi:hypothetical protein